MEKHISNAHIHVLLSCQDWLDQFWAGSFLLEMLDNVDKEREDPRDEQWQRECWEMLQGWGGWSKSPDWTRASSVLTEFAPAGTAMVQMVRTSGDLKKVTSYMTKTWFQSQAILAGRGSVTSYDAVLDFRELAEFHASVPPDRIARQYRIEEATNTEVLDLDHLSWKSKGKVVR